MRETRPSWLETTPLKLYPACMKANPNPIPLMYITSAGTLSSISSSLSCAFAAS